MPGRQALYVYYIRHRATRPQHNANGGGRLPGLVRSPGQPAAFVPASLPVLLPGGQNAASGTGRQCHADASAGQRSISNAHSCSDVERTQCDAGVHINKRDARKPSTARLFCRRICRAWCCGGRRGGRGTPRRAPSLYAGAALNRMFPLCPSLPALSTLAARFAS